MSIVRDITERKLRETRQVAQFALTRIFAEVATLSEALPEILKTICEGFGWELGELWTIDHSLDQLRLECMWHKPSLEASEFERVSSTITFSRGIGLPGRVWSSKQSVVWVTDVVTDSNFPRAAVALKTGLHGAVAFPLMIKDEVNGVMAFFSKKVYPPDEELSHIMADIGRRIGSFVNRKLAESALAERSCLATLDADVGLALVRGVNLRDILQQCTEAVVRNLDVAFARIWTLKKDENMLELQSSAGIYTHIDGAHSRVPVGMYKIGLIAKERKPHLTNEVIGDPRVHNQEWAKQMGMVAFAGYPLIVEDHLVGVIAMFSRKPLTEITLKALDSVSYMIALGIKRKQMEEQLKILSSVIEQSSTTVVITDTCGNIQYANPRFTQLTGYTIEEAIGKNMRILKSGKTPTEEYKRLWNTIASGGKWQGEFCNKKKNGDYFWELAHISPLKNGEGKIINFVAFKDDITSIKQAEEARARLSAIIETTTDFVVTTDKDGNVFYINKAGREMLGIRKNEDVTRLKIYDCHPALVNTLLADEAIPSAIKNGVWTGETVLLSRDGREIPVSQVIIAHMKTNGEVDYLSTIARDITERKHYESQIMYMANRDPLTNLFNRRRFHEELENRIIQTKRFNTQGALLFMDIDNFKYINDSLGHEMGDRLLVNVSNILKERLRDVDTVARLGGDEFAIILSDTNEQNAVQVANQLRELIRQNASIIEGKAVGITISIGISLFPGHSNKAEDLSSYADLAMYQAKEEGRNRACIYTKEQTTHIESRLIWEGRIREALNQNYFMLYLQPVLDIQQNRIAGYEVLLRMRDKKGEIILPSQFLNIAERFGLIRDIEQWVVRESISITKKLCQKGKPSQLEINLSGRVLNDREFLQLIKETLTETGIDPAGLVFEITETAAIENITDAESFIIELKRIGCRFALDDFGTGFSSFNYLKHLSVDYLKIDGSFIQKLPENFTDQHLVKAMVEIAHGLGKKIIAEFVTSEKTLSLLQGFGVDYAQGYFIGKPKPLDEL